MFERWNIREGGSFTVAIAKKICRHLLLVSTTSEKYPELVVNQQIAATDGTSPEMGDIH